MDETEGTTSTTSGESSVSKIPSPPQGQLFAMPGSVPTTKNTTFNDRLNCSSNISQASTSCQTSVLDLTGEDQDLCPFWKESTAALSNRLWLPTKTDCADLDLSLSNGSAKRLAHGSWFSVGMAAPRELVTFRSSQRTFLQSLQCSWPKTTECVQPSTGNDVSTRAKSSKKKKEKSKPAAAKAIKLRVFPTPEQKDLLEQWFGAARWTYNQCLSKVKQGLCKITKNALRDAVVNNINYHYTNQWVTEIPYDIRDEAMNDLIRNYASNFAKGKRFDINFRSRKAQQSITVLAKHWNHKRGVYSSVFSPTALKCERPLPASLQYDCRLIRTSLRQYFVCIPQPLGCESQAPERDVIALDPGVRTFMTGYDPEGRVVQWGKDDIHRIARLLHSQSKLQSKRCKARNHKQRYRMRRAEQRIRNKIHDLVTDCHRKLAKWLCSSYCTILLPKFDTTGIANKLKSRKEKNKLRSWRHCEFRRRLIDKAREYGTTVVLVNEAFTSKTCTGCGTIQNIGRKRTLACKKCQTTIDRDINGSRNILLRCFTQRTSCWTSVVA